MKFELGIEKKRREEIKAKGGKLNFPDAYADFNEKYVQDLLDKRRRESEELILRQKEKKEKMEKMKEAGMPYVKK